MTVWLDAQLTPALARWISEQPWGVDAVAVRELGLRDASDPEIFRQARAAAGQNISLHIEGESNCSIAVLPNKVGIDHSEATAFAFVDRRIGNAHLESLEVTDLFQQGTDALPSP